MPLIVTLTEVKGERIVPYVIITQLRGLEHYKRYMLNDLFVIYYCVWSDELLC